MSMTGGTGQTFQVQERLGAALETHLITASTQELYALWRSKRSRDKFILRKELDIVELSPWIGRLAIHDYLSDTDDYICRLFGETLRRRIGMDMTRHKLSDMPQDIGQRMRARYDRVRISGEPLLCHIMSFAIQLGEPRNEHFPAELLILPLSRSGCEHDCILVLSQILD